MSHLALASMFSPQDLMLVLAVALVFFGPKRLPEIGEAAGNAMRSFKKAVSLEPEALPRTTVVRELESKQI